MICKYCGGPVTWRGDLTFTRCDHCFERDCQIVGLESDEEEVKEIEFESVRVEDEDGYFDVEFKPERGGE